MADEASDIDSDISKQFLQHLENTGFFQQIKDLESSLTAIAGELQKFGQAAAQRIEETENLAAHVIAIESVLTVMLKGMDISEKEVMAEVKGRTAKMSDDPGGSPPVRGIAMDILSRSRGPVN